jgi:hypothetical protein
MQPNPSLVTSPTCQEKSSQPPILGVIECNSLLILLNVNALHLHCF